ncbi:MAG: TIGR02281 family clan AA aspartic protease [Zoogloeaceae bacterium]|nr:TIGR02281 family clan AA aspartic protease [Zoogloeaceae bacterium]
MLVVGEGAPRTVGVGQSAADGVRLIAVDHDSAVVEVHGRRQTLRLGERSISVASQAGQQSAILQADGKGHFITAGSLNGATVVFLVDTGASVISLGAGDASRAGIDYRRSEAVPTLTANGITRVWPVKIDQVRVGDILIRNVDGAVHEMDLPVVLLGMSFLNRMEMVRTGERLELRQRY